MVQKLVHALRHTHPHSPPISMYSLCKLQNLPSLMLQLPIYTIKGDYDYFSSQELTDMVQGYKTRI